MHTYVSVIKHISFLVAPTISLEVMDQIQDERDTASFTCQATGEPVPTISWYLNGISINNDTDVDKYDISETSVDTTTINSALTIISVKSSDVGTYTCNATNVVSSDTSSGILTVNGEFEYLYFISKVTILHVQLPQTLLHNSLISLKEVMDQSHVQLQVILYQQLYGRTVMGVV